MGRAALSFSHPTAWCRLAPCSSTAWGVESFVSTKLDAVVTWAVAVYCALLLFPLLSLLLTHGFLVASGQTTAEWVRRRRDGSPSPCSLRHCTRLPVHCTTALCSPTSPSSVSAPFSPQALSWNSRSALFADDLYHHQVQRQSSSPQFGRVPMAPYTPPQTDSPPPESDGEAEA